MTCCTVDWNSNNSALMGRTIGSLNHNMWPKDKQYTRTNQVKYRHTDILREPWWTLQEVFCPIVRFNTQALETYCVSSSFLRQWRIESLLWNVAASSENGLVWPILFNFHFYNKGREEQRFFRSPVQLCAPVSVQCTSTKMHQNSSRILLRVKYSVEDDGINLPFALYNVHPWAARIRTWDGGWDLASCGWDLTEEWMRSSWVVDEI
jgi:hypothetical protein